MAFLGCRLSRLEIRAGLVKAPIEHAVLWALGGRLVGHTPPVNTLIKRTLGFLAIHWLEPTLSAKCFLSENVWAGFGAF